ncbi:ABC transporter permease [candidate division KSB1 bacterium]|nr:ABC transporter permease [candidate division KSB1 bacterium]
MNQHFAFIACDKFRFLIMWLSMAIGVFSLTSVQLISKLTHRLIYQEIESIGINRIWLYRDFDENTIDPWNADEQLNLNHVKQIVTCCPMVINSAPSIISEYELRYGNNCWDRVRVIATVSEWTAIKNEKMNKGKFLSEIDNRRHNYVCVLSYEACESLFKEREPIHQKILLNGEYFTVIGVLEKKERPLLNMIGAAPVREELIIIPLSVMQSHCWKKTHNIQYLDLQVSNMSEMNSAIKKINHYLSLCFGTSVKFKIKTLRTEIKRADNIMHTLTISLTVIAGIVLLLAGLGIMNTMLAAVKERYFEIGIRRAVGARKNDILKQFLSEAALIGIIGGLTGIISAIGLYSLILRWIGNAHVSVIFPIISGLLISVITGLLAGIYPAIRASSLNPIEALRNG